MTNCLYSVCVEKYILTLANFTNLFNRFNSSYLIIGKHNSNQTSVVFDSIF